MRQLPDNKRDELDRTPGNGLGTRLQALEEAGVLRLQKWDAPDAAAAAVVLAATTLANGATTLVESGITQPDYPRALSITGNQGTATGDVVITGTDYDDNVITETITSTGAATVPGAQAFKTVTSVLLPARHAGGDTISVGITDVLGAKQLLARDSVLLAFFNGAREGTLPTVVTDADEVCKNTFDPNSALDASGDLEIVWLDLLDRV